MSKLTDFLSGKKVLEERDSAANGKLIVVRDLAWGVHIQADGLTQSGGVVIGVWKSALKKASEIKNLDVKTCLILGLGGGTIAKLVSRKHPTAVITGVDIDPEIVNLGKKYFTFDWAKVEVVIDDGFNYCKSAAKKRNKFDLILVDMYQGSHYPAKFEDEDFIKLVSSLLSESGQAIFNRLFYGEKRILAYKFLRKLEKVFKNVTPIYPQANVLFICDKS